VLAGEATPSRVKLPLLKAVVRARRWALELISGQVNSVDEIARREHLINARYGGCCGWASCPRGSSRRSPKATSRPISPFFSLMRRVDLPLLWNAQEQAFGLR